MFLGCVLATILAATPEANLTVIGPDSVQAGAVVAFDGGKSHSDFPLSWACSPPEGASLRQFPDGAAWFIAGNPGRYNIILVASGWKDAAKTQLEISVAARTITVGSPKPPDPPEPPEPTDPLAKAARQYRIDLTNAYSANYAAAAQSIRSRRPIGETQKALSAAMVKSARDAFNARFSPWAPLFPPDGTEPTNESQWKAIEDLMASISGAFR